MEMILNILCGAIPLLYLIIYTAKQNKKRGKKHYVYGLVVCAVLFLILFVIRLIALTFITNESSNPDTTTTTKTTTTEEVTTVSTTTKNSDYKKITTSATGETLGTTSKGYKVEKLNGLYYVDGYLIANKTYTLPKSYNPGGLVSEVQKAANKMITDADKNGWDLYVASGFRSYDTQNTIYNNYVKRDGQKEADTYSARAGHSEHQSGLAFDICDHKVGACITSGFDNTAQAKWLAENAYKYGFILRYPKGSDKVAQTGYMYESWHFRYVGEDLAEKLYNNGDWITMEEYFGLTSAYDEKPIGE